MITDEEKLIVENINLAYDVAWKYTKKLKGLIGFEDLISIANLGLVKAANTYDSKLGRFSTYVYRVMINEINKELKQVNKHKEILSYNKICQLTDNNSYEEVLSDNFNLEELVILKDLSIDLYKYIDKIEKSNKLQAKILRLILLDYTQTAISEILGIAQPQVSFYLKQAIYKLRMYFKVTEKGNFKNE